MKMPQEKVDWAMRYYETASMEERRLINSFLADVTLDFGADIESMSEEEAAFYIYEYLSEIEKPHK